MAENQTVGTEAPSGAEGTPSQPVSPPVQAPIQGDVTQLLSTFGEELKGLRQEMRGLQGRQDKTTNQFSDFQKQLARMEQYKTQYGLNDAEALQEMANDDRAEQRWMTIEQKIDQLAGRMGDIGNTPGAQQMVTKALESYKLDPRDPFVAAAMQGKSFANETEAELFAARVFRDKQLSPNPNPAQASTSPGGFQGTANADALAAEMQTLYKNPTAPGAMQRITEIGEILKKAG